ncbi:MAG: T9SS type A sorting domain-containing protein [Candidatus Eisenbacteria bacterium]|nr:T9SS type A sorting domain-containing protein [Candidatus Eisenbacteria bacterium]
MKLHPVSIADGGGGVIVVWETMTPGTATTDLHAQRILLGGRIAPGWPADGVPVCTAIGSQLDPALAPDGGGGAFIAWEDMRENASTPNGLPKVFVQHLAAGGTIAPGWPVNGADIAASPGLQLHPRVAPDGAGGVHVTWEDGRAGIDIYVQRLTGAGAVAAGWPANGLAVCTTPGEKGFPDIVSDGGAPGYPRPARVGAPGEAGSGSGAIVAWHDRRGTDFDIYAQRVTAAGAIAPGWAADGARVSTGTTQQLYPRLLADGGGGAFLTWNDMSGFYTEASNLYVQHVTGSGALAPGWSGAGVAACTAPEAQYHAGLVPDGGAPTGGGSGVIAVWQDYRDHRGQIFMQRVTAGGTVAWAADGIPITSSAGYQAGASAVPDTGGGAIITWSEWQGDSAAHAYALRVTGAGAAAPGWPAQGLVLCEAPGWQGETTVAPDGGGGAVVAWSDGRDNIPDGANRYDIYAQHILGDARVPAVLSVVRTQLEVGRVRLTWHDPGSVVTIATIQRRGAGRDWADAGDAVADARGLIVFEDAGVLPGRRYDYRLSYLLGDVIVIGGETSLTVPPPPALVLHGTRPNPALASLTVWLTLPGWSTATLDLLDLAGRRVRSVPVDEGPGTHTVDLGSTAALKPGAYFLRITQDGASETARVSVVK